MSFFVKIITVSGERHRFEDWQADSIAEVIEQAFERYDVGGIVAWPV